MDELLTELGSDFGPRERVIEEYVGSVESGIIQSGTIYPALNVPIHETADAAIQELRKTWGPTADPHWVDGIVPGRGQQQDQTEFDCLFALFRRAGVWGYVRLRAPETDTPQNAYLRLVFGVVRDTTHQRPNKAESRK